MDINNKIVSIIPLSKTISFIVHINNICNFKCDYCTAGRQVSVEKLSYNQILKITKSIKELRRLGDNRNIIIDITGGEPTLDNDLIKILKEFLLLDNLEIKVTTNLFRLTFFENEIKNITNNPNVNNLEFNISFHFFEYKNRVGNFIKSLNILLKHKINFKIKFLLPNKNICLADFLIVKNEILSKTNITENNCKYDLIINKSGKVSTTYSKDILDYFYNKQFLLHRKGGRGVLDLRNKFFRGLSNEGWLDVEYDCGKKEKLSMFDIRTRGLNTFKGLDCFYISKDSTEINVSHKGYITFGPCSILDKIRYNIEDIKGLLILEKKILCSEKFCDCGINLKKILTPHKQNRHWVRISSICNNKCLFCLDSDAQNGYFIDNDRVRQDITKGLKKGEDNRLILSGGEASINPCFSEYIRFGKELGYDRIQTITNGNRFSDMDFCRTVFDAGLDEVTFSMHGHTDRLHDYLVDTPGAFRKSLQGMINIRKHFPQVILNIDIVVNKMNVRFLPEIVKFYMKLGIMEFDILQIIPFGRGFSEYRNELFYDPGQNLDFLQKTWELSRLEGVHIWTNRFPSEVLEGYEELIQDPEKIRSEVMGEGREMFENFIEKGEKPQCFGERCEICFIRQYCDHFLQAQKKELDDDKKKFIINESLRKNITTRSGYIILRGEENPSRVYEIFGKDSQGFVEAIQSLSVSEDAEFINIPRCIRVDHNLGNYENRHDMETEKTLEDYTKNYIINLYRKKSLRCKRCKYDAECEGIHINFIRAYGFKILQPLA